MEKLLNAKTLGVTRRIWRQILMRKMGVLHMKNASGRVYGLGSELKLLCDCACFDDKGLFVCKRINTCSKCLRYDRVVFEKKLRRGKNASRGGKKSFCVSRAYTEC